jgi:hypothetical protein
VLFCYCRSWFIRVFFLLEGLEGVFGISAKLFYSLKLSMVLPPIVEYTLVSGLSSCPATDSLAND